MNVNINIHKIGACVIDPFTTSIVLLVSSITFLLLDVLPMHLLIKPCSLLHLLELISVLQVLGKPKTSVDQFKKHPGGERQRQVRTRRKDHLPHVNRNLLRPHHFHVNNIFPVNLV